MTKFVGEVVTVELDEARIASLFARYPARTAFHLRDFLGACFGSHRRTWLERMELKRKGMARTNFFYRVEPKANVKPSDSDVALGLVNLAKIKGEAFTKSTAAKLHETGGEVLPVRSRFLALPIGVTLTAKGNKRKIWATPARYRAREGKPLIAKAEGGRLTLFQVRTRGKKRFLVPAYRLVPSVRIKPKLRFFATWGELASDRARRFSEAADKITAGGSGG